MIRRVIVCLAFATGVGCGDGETQEPANESLPSYGDARAVPTSPTGIQGGDILISYALVDEESDSLEIRVEFSTDGGLTYRPATEGPGGEGTTALASAPEGGKIHAYDWNSLADGVAPAESVSRVRVRVTASDGVSGPPAATAEFAVDNSDNQAPKLVRLWTPEGAQSGLVAIPYALQDPEANPCAISVVYSVDGGATYKPATPGPGGDGTDRLSALGEVDSHRFIWNAWADLRNKNVSARIRITPSDGKRGASAETEEFWVQNAELRSGDPVPSAASLKVDGSDTMAQPRMTSDHRSLYLTRLSDDAESWQVEARDLFDWSVRETIPLDLAAPPAFLPGAIAVDGRSLYLACIKNAGGRKGVLHFERRKLADGALAYAVEAQENIAALMEVGARSLHLSIDGSYAYLAMTEIFPTGDARFRVEKRNLSDGSLVRSFAQDGVLTSNPSAFPDWVTSLTMEGEYLYVTGAQEFMVLGEKQVRTRLRYEKIRRSDGSRDIGFGAGGTVVEEASGGVTFPSALVTRGEYLYSLVGEGWVSEGYTLWRLDQRRISDGFRVHSEWFAHDRLRESTFAEGALAVSESGLYTAVGSWSQWPMEASGGQVGRRLLPDLRPDPAFGWDGLAASTFTPGMEGFRECRPADGIVILLGRERISNPPTAVSSSGKEGAEAEPQPDPQPPKEPMVAWRFEARLE